MAAHLALRGHRSNIILLARPGAPFQGLEEFVCPEGSGPCGCGEGESGQGGGEGVSGQAEEPAVGGY